MTNRLPCLASLFLATTLGCACSDDDPVSHSAPIGLTLSAKSDDVQGDGTITDDKNITTESGNPWGKFVDDAEAELGGAPGSIELVELTLLLGADSDGVTELREIFDGTVDVQFELEDTGNFYSVASANIDADTEGREVSFERLFDYEEFDGAEVDALLAGSFKVLLGGPAAAGFADANADADMQLTLVFEAFE